MTIGVNEENIIQAFFNNVPTCLVDRSNDATISYLAVARNGKFVVVAARMMLGDDLKDDELPRQLKTPNVRAGYFRLNTLGPNVREYLNNAVTRDELEIPGDALSFPGNSGGHSAWFREFDDASLHANKRVALLTMFGAHRDGFNTAPSFDWELKAAPVPFDGIDDLAAVYRFGSIAGGTISFEIVAPNALEVSAASRVQRTSARLILLPGYTLNRKAVSLRLRLVSQGRTADRLTVDESEIRWSVDGTGQEFGTFDAEVPEGATVYCTAVYEGRAQHERTIVDQSARDNMMRIAFESSDRGLQNLKAFLASGGETMTNGRNVESAVAWILTMLGFQVLHIGMIDKLQDSVDIIACSPSNGLLLVECTSGILKDDKTSQLVSRAAKLTAALGRSGFASLSVIPVMLTTMPQCQIGPRISATERNGVLVMCREQVDEWLELSAAAPDANLEFSRLERRLRDVRSAAGPEPDTAGQGFS